MNFYAISYILSESVHRLKVSMYIFIKQTKTPVIPEQEYENFTYLRVCLYLGCFLSSFSILAEISPNTTPKIEPAITSTG